MSGKTRTLGKITATLLTSSMIVGIGLFTSLGAATSQAQSGILIAMLIGGVIALLTGLSASQVGVNYPEEGGAFIWVRRFGYPTASFVAGCAYLLDGIIGIGILGLAFANYSQQIFPWLPVQLAALVALIIVALINLLGIKPTARVLIGAFTINTLLLAVYVALSIPKMQPANLTPLLGTGFAGVLGGAATFFWSWDGFQRTAIMADQIKSPRETIPFAVVVGISIAAAIYLVVAASTLAVLGAIQMGSNDTPVFLSATVAIGTLGGWIILLSSWVSSFSEMLGDMLPTSKVARAMGAENELPHRVGFLHARFQSPYYALAMLTGIGIPLVLLFPIRTLIPVASAFTLVWYLATNFSALKLPREERFLPYAFTWAGVLACLGLFAFLPAWSIIVAVGVLTALGVIRLVLKKPYRAPASRQSGARAD